MIQNAPINFLSPSHCRLPPIITITYKYPLVAWSIRAKRCWVCLSSGLSVRTTVSWCFLIRNQRQSFSNREREVIAKAWSRSWLNSCITRNYFRSWGTFGQGRTSFKVVEVRSLITQNCLYSRLPIRKRNKLFPYPSGMDIPIPLPYPTNPKEAAVTSFTRCSMHWVWHVNAFMVNGMSKKPHIASQLSREDVLHRKIPEDDLSLV